MAGDILEVYEDSDVDEQECEDFADGDLLKRKTTLPMSNTVTIHAESSKDAKQRKSKRKKLTKTETSKKRKLAQNKKLLGLVRPDVATNKEKERLLKRIATKGVVQLFNAVSDRQRVLADELSKKMTAKERKEAEKRLQGSAFRVYSDVYNREVDKKEPNDSDEDGYIKEEENV